MADNEIGRVIDQAIEDGSDLLSKVERAKLRAIIANYEKNEQDRVETWPRVKKMLVAYERSEWLWGKILSWSKMAFACAAAAVAVKTLFGGFLADFIQAFRQVTKP